MLVRLEAHLDTPKSRMLGNIILGFATLFPTVSTFYTPSLTVRTRESPGRSTEPLSCMSCNGFEARLGQMAMSVERSESKDRWESIYDFFRSKSHVERRQQKENIGADVEMKGESDMSECFQCSDIARAPDDSTKSEVPTRTNIRASKPTLSSLARRKDPRVRSLTAIPSTSASPTMESLAPTPSHKSFLPHWSYKKSSIAAATVITVIAAVGLVVLIVLLIRRLRQSWKRYRKRKREYVKSKYYAISPLDDNIGAYTFATPESRMSRETLMFGRSRSNSMTYVVEEAIDKGAVTRVICASKNALLASPLDFISASGRSEVDQEDVSGPDILKEPGRAGFVPRRVVIISPSLSPVESITACEVGRKSWSRPNEQVALRELQKIPPSPVKQQKEVRPASSSKTPDTDMNNLFRLPSIERSTSPLFSF